MKILCKESKTLYLKQKQIKEFLVGAGVEKMKLDGAWLEKKEGVLVLHFSEVK